MCRFKSVSDYGSMVRDLREGKLRDVKIKGQTYRAVSLERKQIKSTVSLLLTLDQVCCLVDISRIYLEGGEHRDFPSLRLISPP